MFGKIRKPFFYIFLLLLIATIVYWRWLSFNIFYGGDWPFYLKYSLEYFMNISVWFTLNNLGSVYLTLWRLPIDFSQGLIGGLGFGSNVSEKFIVFWPTLIVANVSSFLLVRKITKSNIAGFIGAVVFNYNTYFFVINTAFLIYSASAWSVLMFYIFIHAIEKKKLVFFLLSALVLFITGSYDFRVCYISLFLILSYVLYNLFIIGFKKQAIKVMAYSLVSLIIFALLNTYWVLSFMNAHSLVSNAILQRGLFGNEFLNMPYAITLFHPFWTGGHTAYFSPQPIFFYFWIIPIIAFLGFYLNRKNKNVVFFGLIALIGILLTKQVGTPFSSTYPWLYAHLPGFSAFREASKFYYLIILGYCVLIGSFISWLEFTRQKYINKYNLKYIAYMLILIIFLGNTLPIINSKISDIFIPRYINSDYNVVNSYLLKQHEYFRTLWVPGGTNWSYASLENPIISSAYILASDWSIIAKPYAVGSSTTGEYIMKFLEGGISKNLLSISSVKYIIVPEIDIKNNDNVFLPYVEPRDYYISNLNKVSYLRRINLGNSKILLYENSSYRPHIYTTQREETITKELSYQEIQYNCVNTVEYALTLNHVRKPLYVNFSESYNPSWEMRIGDFNWFQVLIDKDYFLPTKWHFQNNAMLNSFYIDPSTVCNVKSLSSYKVTEGGCIRNSDGTYTIHATLYFAPQSYMYLGLIISGATLAGVLGYLGFMCYTFLRKRYAKHN